MNAQRKYPPAPEEIKFEPKVLVVGGGASGILSAEKAAELGLSVVLIEKTGELGGKAAQLSFLYQSDLSPSQWLKDKISSLEKNEKVNIYKNSQLEKLKGQAGNFKVTLDLEGKTEEMEVGAIIMATGMELSSNLPAEVDKGADSFLSQMEFEKQFSQLASGDNKTFVLVVKEDDFLIGCTNAMKYSIKLKEANHNVYVFFDEMKVSEEGTEKLYHQAREKGVAFIRGTNNLKIGQEEGNFTLTTIDPQLPVKLAKELVINFDYYIFNEDLLPGADTAKLAEIIRVNMGPGGFFQEDNYHVEPVYANRAGIYFVGACRMPDLLHNIQEQAGAAVNSIYQLSVADVKELMEEIPLIDVVKCVYCLTCYRSCPRNAIDLLYEIEEAAWNGAPYLHPLSCQKCGCCVAECPNRAISFPGYTDEDMQKEFKEIGGKA
ncbi:MAG: CoB--CoM heterodisulfide reductase iron-sulfur subunit A family protein [Candidatus Syntrophonatronum acetioxidans]|uniref:CoB--CoM heterodisulfide reductase iron-sulfur subunit A family protein n=1 Tax=Candidatus Syntrophonatronum acetioxidans TaxID=1795816 RepID=A0A424YIL3_9FIRM|nr:MAG: CoB--CoM heterodisulfide reductase iron-sulfur subunit A family protein [Candidatus Syntrophonatronum acetioxidans]